MDGLRRFLSTSAGKVLGILILIVAASAFYLQLREFFRPAALAAVRTQVFIDAETGKAFEHELVKGEMIPIVSPDTGKNTGYPAELCYWTKDGGVKTDPTAVLLNIYRGKSGPTFCPDCGRLVVGHNPMAVAGNKPPPTQQEYELMHQAPVQYAPAQSTDRNRN
jgi:hypothetical protein